MKNKWYVSHLVVLLIFFILINGIMAQKPIRRRGSHQTEQVQRQNSRNNSITNSNRQNIVVDNIESINKESSYVEDFKKGQLLFNAKNFYDAKIHFENMLLKYASHEEELGMWIISCENFLQAED